MEKEVLATLKKIADYSYDEWHAGLNTMIRTHEHFAKYVDKNYRVKQYEENGDFYMTSNEHYFHLIGFMDAVIWLQRAGFFCNRECHSSDEEYEPENDEERTLFEESENKVRAIHRLIINFETGE